MNRLTSQVQALEERERRKAASNSSLNAELVTTRQNAAAARADCKRLEAELADTRSGVNVSTAAQDAHIAKLQDQLAAARAECTIAQDAVKQV